MEEAEPTEPIWLRLDDILTTAQTSHSGFKQRVNVLHVNTFYVNTQLSCIEYAL